MPLVRSLALLVLLFMSSAAALAQDYPSRPITMIVPFSAGGPGDVIARILGTAMSVPLKQSFVIENVVGAGGTLGTNRVAKATPDGHTLLLMHVGQATAPALYAKLPFDPVGDFAMIGLVTDVPMILVARPNFPAKDLKELVERIRSEGDKMTMANVGLGSASQLCGLMFMSATDTKLTSVFYKGGGPALNDVIAGHIDVYCDPATGPTPHIRSRTIKGLCDHKQEARSNIARCTDVGRSRRPRIRRHHMVRPLCASRHTETGRRHSGRRPADGA